jgi:ubiquinone/menaquinone biosynthesis C-methylase UbiE
VPADQAVANDYDSFAEAYSAGNEANLVSAYYERPAILNLAGDVAGRRILDAGCGSGPLFADLRVADLSSPLPRSLRGPVLGAFLCFLFFVPEAV